MGLVMFPTLLYADYTGNGSIVFAGIVGGVVSGASVILFPDPKHLERISKKLNKDSDDESE